MKPRPLLVAIVGPTAAGKTDCALAVAEQLNAEIVSADSMQIYRGMDIGTAKPSAEQRARVPHHMIDIVNPDEPYNVAEYARDAHAAIAEILARGKLPLLVGGSGLYVRAVTCDMDLPVAPPNPKLRAELAELAQREGREAVHARLAAVDPASAQRIHPNDLKRVIRAIEVFHETGRPLSQQYRSKPPPSSRYDVLLFGLTCARSALYERIERRIDNMLARGLVDEVRGLLQRGYDPQLQSMQAIGYKEIAAYLLGEIPFAEAERLLRRNTRRFAKRQLTWFRADDRISWIDVDAAPAWKVILNSARRARQGRS